MFDRKNSSAFDFSPGTCVQSTYLIASTPRTGSTLLADLLWSTGKAGAPLEYLHDKHSLDYRDRWGFSSIEEYARMLLRFRTSGNGVFGMKAHYHQLNNFGLDFNSLEKLFHSPKYLFVQRNDKLRQAISYVKAMQTRQWAASEGEVVHKGRYDYNEICNAVRLLAVEAESWKTYFSNNGISPLVIEYETFVKDAGKGLDAVCQYIGITRDSEPLDETASMKMANAETEEWVDRFLAERSGNHRQRQVG
ncbi:MAG TPA: hypothetical protein ENJ80_05825 [Gammaproteobacteria bacterium]|nr:hypothetical protein [Gammaproteobacteria bacterium]